MALTIEPDNTRKLPKRKKSFKDLKKKILEDLRNKKKKKRNRRKELKISDANNIRKIKTQPGIPEYIYKLDPKRYGDEYRRRKIV